MKKELEDYLNLVIPQPLEENEYIRLLMISTKTEIPKVLYLKTFEEVSEAIKKHIFYCNIFISLATYLKKGADEPEIYRRQVIFLDFDKKDFPDFEELSQYSNLIKSKFPSLFYHCVVASGSGGYHYYISLEPAPLEDIVKINKDIAKIVGADIKAANSKQIVRIPTSNNLKDMNNKKYVKVVANTYGTEKFIPYTTERLKNMVQFCSHKNEIVVPKQEPPIIKDDFTENFYCVEQMINLGCKAGERNFAMGRIIAKLKNEQHQYNAAQKIILDWNKRCSPPKAENDVKNEFDRYWQNDNYKLLGCHIEDKRKSEILKQYCDKAKCLRYGIFDIKNDTKDAIYVSEKLLDKRNIRRLNGNHYFIIFLLIASGNKINKVKLRNLIKDYYTDKSYNKVINELLTYKIISETYKEYILKTANRNYDKRVKIKTTIIRAFLTAKISKTDFVIYLALCVLLQTKNNATYDTLSEYLDKEKSSISKYIQKLYNENIIDINKVINEKGLECNRYTFL